MSESLQQRRRRKFVAGGLEQLATLSGGLAVGVLTAGVIAPIVAALGGAIEVSAALLALLIAGSLAFTVALAIFAVVVRGRAKVRDDDKAAELQAAFAVARLRAPEEGGDAQS